MEIGRTQLDSLGDLAKQFEEIKKQLLQAGKFAELGIMAASIIHEIKQPLLGIKAFAQMIQEETKEDKSIGRKADLIVKQSIIIEKMIARILEFSRTSEKKFQPMDIVQPVESALELLSYKFKRSNITLEKHIRPDLPKVMGDGILLQQVFVNLINNARDAVEGVEKAIIGVSLSSVRERGTIEALIYDNGCGVPPEDADRIFDPFFSTKEVGIGTGLGLFISREIIKEHSGTLDLVRNGGGSGPPAGARTVFRVTLPVVQP